MVFLKKLQISTIVAPDKSSYPRDDQLLLAYGRDHFMRDWVDDLPEFSRQLGGCVGLEELILDFGTTLPRETLVDLIQIQYLHFYSEQRASSGSR